jgi:hypothetical protein
MGAKLLHLRTDYQNFLKCMKNQVVVSCDKPLSQKSIIYSIATKESIYFH